MNKYVAGLLLLTLTGLAAPTLAAAEPQPGKPTMATTETVPTTGDSLSGPVDEKVQVHYADLFEVQYQLRCLQPTLACQISDAHDAVALRGTPAQLEQAKEVIRVMDYERSQPGSAGNAHPY